MTRDAKLIERLMDVANALPATEWRMSAQLTEAAVALDAANKREDNLKTELDECSRMLLVVQERCATLNK